MGNSPRYVGFIDPPYIVTLTDDSGAALDLTGCTSNSFTLTMLNQNTGLSQQGVGVWTVANQTTNKGLVSYQWTTTDMATSGPWWIYTTVKLPSESSPRQFDPELILILPGTVGAGAAPPGVLPAPIAKALYFNATDYGALPGNSALVNTTALQNTINAAIAAGAGTILVEQGVYDHTGLTIPKGGITLMGVGPGATILNTPAGSEAVAPLIIGDGVNTCADVCIRDIEFTSTNQKTANAAIKLQKCFRTHIERIRLQNQFRGIHVYNSTATWIDDSDLRDTKENGIVYEATLSNGYDLYLNNVLADNPDITNNGSGILWLGGENLVIQNCDFEHYTTGFTIAPPAGQQCRFGFFINAEFDTSGDNGLKISSAGGDIVGLTFTNGWTGTSTNYGTLIDNGSGGLTQGVRFIGHKSLHNGLAGMRLAGGLDVELNGCDVVGNSQTVANSRSGIEIASTSMTFSIIGCRSTNGWQQGNTQSNGINFDSGTYTSGLIANNDLRGNTNNAISLNGAVGVLQIKNNQGHNPIGHAVTQPSVPASTVAYTNNSGYDCMVLVSGGTVTQIALGGTNTGLTSGWFRVPANQTIAITYSVAPTWQWWAE